MDCSPSGSSVHGIFQARVLEWVAVAFSRGPSWPRDRTQVSCIVGGFFTIWATREILHSQHTSVQMSHICSAHSRVQLGAASVNGAVLQLNRFLSSFVSVILSSLCLWVNQILSPFPSLSPKHPKSHLLSPYDLKWSESCLVLSDSLQPCGP